MVASQRPSDVCADEVGGGKEVAGELVVSGSDATPVFDAAEVVLDSVALAVDAFGAIGFDLVGAAARDDGQGTFILDLLTHLFAVVGLVAGDGERRPGRREDIFDNLTVMDLSAGDNEVQRPAFAVDDGVGFRAPPTPADPDRLIFLPPYGWPAPYSS